MCRLRFIDGDVQRSATIVQKRLPQYDYGAWIARVVHGKYMDILPISSVDPEQNNGFYKSRVRLTDVGGVATFGWSHAWDTGINMFSLKSFTRELADEMTSIRLAFQGEIVEVKDVSSYKVIPNNF